MRRMVFAIATTAAVCAASSHADTVIRAGANWTQWGGATRDFVSDSKGLAATWPPGGPRKLWSRALGEGHSAILVEGDRLYTMYRPAGLMTYVRRSGEEVIAALDAASGKTIWEYK